MSAASFRTLPSPIARAVGLAAALIGRWAARARLRRLVREQADACVIAGV